MNAEKSALQNTEELCLPKNDEVVQVLQHLFSSTNQNDWPDDSIFDMELREELFYSLRDAFSASLKLNNYSRIQTLQHFIDEESLALFYEQKQAFVNNEL